ncbi:2'-5' RNA ligase family protein [Deinococcus sp. UR1]|uniref:2'-5' RNA ligase family protein n=1 Tax=Deinococcus sp. UR1 TaxID=1704277 RepID=UPI000C19D37D|nr:2'-5' RNA ligase family protein [Deinococcus sp. UR1]PIG96914.1 hypothetical protein AMD26_015425 [Deinococcus sp. UR1]
MNIPHLLASLAALYDVQPQEGKYKGIIIALAVPADAARRAAVPDGLPADEMHVTLAYLGTTDQQTDAVPLLNLAHALSDLADHTPPVTAHFGGPGKFLGVAGGKDAAYLSVDAPQLPQLREATVRAAQQAGMTVDTTHGFTPHVTLTYQEPGTPHPREQKIDDPFAFPTLGLWIGGSRVSFPLRAPRAEQAFAKAAGARPADPRAAQALLAQLGGDLARLTRQDQAIIARTDEIRQHHQRVFGALMAHIPAARGSALEDAALHHAGEAAGATRAAAL